MEDKVEMQAFSETWRPRYSEQPNAGILRNLLFSVSCRKASSSQFAAIGNESTTAGRFSHWIDALVLDEAELGFQLPN